MGKPMRDLRTAVQKTSRVYHALMNDDDRRYDGVVCFVLQGFWTRTAVVWWSMLGRQLGVVAGAAGGYGADAAYGKAGVTTGE